MTENSTRIPSMQVNKQIIAAAKDTVQSAVDATAAIEVLGYPGMFVSSDACEDIQPVHYFEANNARYAIGPRRKK